MGNHRTPSFSQTNKLLWFHADRIQKMRLASNMFGAMRRRWYCPAEQRAFDSDTFGPFVSSSDTVASGAGPRKGQWVIPCSGCGAASQKQPQCPSPIWTGGIIMVSGDKVVTDRLVRGLPPLHYTAITLEQTGRHNAGSISCHTKKTDLATTGFSRWKLVVMLKRVASRQ